MGKGIECGVEGAIGFRGCKAGGLVEGAEIPVHVFSCPLIESID